MKKVTLFAAAFVAAMVATWLIFSQIFIKMNPHPRLEAHRFLEQKTPAALLFEWIPYYYRHPRPQETVEVIKVFLAQENPEQGNVAAENHLFATILHKNQEELAKLKAEPPRYAGKQLERLTAIIKETENYQKIENVTTETVESLWAEFFVTGNKEIIARMVQAVEPTTSYQDQAFFNTIRDGFYRYLPAHKDALAAFNKASKEAPEDRRSILEKIRKDVREMAERANMHLVRADNHAKQRDYIQALNELEKALEYYPDYANVFINAANIYEQQRRLREARAAMEKAVQINHDSNTACYGMGRHAFFQGKHEEAIEWYSKALKGQSKNSMYVHAIARSYQEKGDTANAVKYFQQYLQLAPKGEHVELVKRYLASVNAPVVTKSSPLLDAFKKKDFQALEMQLATILKEKKKDQDGHSLLSKAYGEICNNPDAEHAMDKWSGDLEDWLKRNPSSHFANAAMGQFYVNYAWHARGSGWANTVTREGWRLFEARLNKARDYLEKAYLSDPSDPMAPRWLIKVAMGLGSGYAEMEKQFQRAIQADKSEYETYLAKLTYLMPKWGGTEEKMFAFARETAKNAPADSLAPLVVAKAHWEMYYRSEDQKAYFKQTEVWNEVRSVYSELCRRFPNSKELHTWFSRTARLAGDDETAKREWALAQEAKDG